VGWLPNRLGTGRNPISREPEPTREAVQRSGAKSTCQRILFSGNASDALGKGQSEALKNNR